MSDKEPLSKEQRADLCYDDRCKEHSDGERNCPIPLYKEDLQKALKESNSESALGSADPRKATASVVRSND